MGKLPVITVSPAATQPSCGRWTARASSVSAAPSDLQDQALVAQVDLALGRATVSSAGHGSGPGSKPREARKACCRAARECMNSRVRALETSAAPASRKTALPAVWSQW